MTELLKRFSDYDKWFIDGLTNQMCGYYENENFDCKPDNLPFQTLTAIMQFYVEICEENVFFRSMIETRWECREDKEDIFQDLYEQIMNENEIFFYELSQQYPLPL